LREVRKDEFRAGGIVALGRGGKRGDKLRLVDAETATERPLRAADGSPLAGCWMGSKTWGEDAPL